MITNIPKTVCKKSEAKKNAEEAELKIVTLSWQCHVYFELDISLWKMQLFIVIFLC